MPTWGKIIHEAHIHATLLHGHYYWLHQPAFLLFLAAFAMTGVALDRMLTPALRDARILHGKPQTHHPIPLFQT